MKITKKIKTSRFFMEPGIAEISAGYANNVKYCQELRICLSVHDWSKFVKEAELLPKYLESAIKQNSERIRKLKPFAICEITEESP